MLASRKQRGRDVNLFAAWLFGSRSLPAKRGRSVGRSVEGEYSTLGVRVDERGTRETTRQRETERVSERVRESKIEKLAEKVVVASVVVVATSVGVVGRENRRWVDRCMNIHDLTTNPYTATGLCLHYCISNSADGSQNSLFAATGPVPPIRPSRNDGHVPR